MKEVHTNEGKWKFSHGMVVETDAGFFNVTEVAREDVHVSNMVTPHFSVSEKKLERTGLEVNS